jgi:hypothetical protein
VPSLYAADTQVTPEKTRNEIERAVRKYGADEFGYSETQDAGMVTFRIGGRRIKFTIQYPDVDSFRTTPGGRWRPVKQREPARQQEIRRLWRSLLMAIKAKLDLAASGIVEFEEEFMANTVYEGGRTVYEIFKPQLERAYNGPAPLMLVAGRSR